MRTVVRQSTCTINCEVSPWTICSCYLLWWASFLAGGLYLGSYTMFSLMAPHERIFLAVRFVSHVHGLACGPNSTFIPGVQLNEMYCDRAHPDRMPCTK